MSTLALCGFGITAFLCGVGLQGCGPYGGGGSFLPSRPAFGPQPNPPRWPASVHVFRNDSTNNISDFVQEAFARNGGKTPACHGQWSEKRYAFLFMPGQYSVDVPVGYYTQVLGLGSSPDDVVFTSSKGVYAEDGGPSPPSPGALNNFWRGVENLKVQGKMKWAVSQASPLRRVHVGGDLALFDRGWASGGFMANCRINGTVNPGSQQQWITRNSELNEWLGNGMNMVFVGTEGAPNSSCGASSGHAVVNVGQTPRVAEKPYITIDETGKYFLIVPRVKTTSMGLDWEIANVMDVATDATTDRIPFDHVHVATPSESAENINQFLAAGFHVVLSPGIYNVSEPIVVSKPNQVLLGLGLATVVSVDGNAVIKVEDVDGARVAGVILESGSKNTKVLLQWGSENHRGSEDNPGVMSDVYVRVGGPKRYADAHVETMMHIASGYVIGDNVWLWRADHDVDASIATDDDHPLLTDNSCDHALNVTGSDVIFYGLAAEHTNKDIVVWSGERGQTYFMQSELPYHANATQWGNSVGYRVTEQVKDHVVYGAGIYHYFLDTEVNLTHVFASPTALENKFHSAFVFKIGDSKGEVDHIVNDRVDVPAASVKTGMAYWCPNVTNDESSATSILV